MAGLQERVRLSGLCQRPSQLPKRPVRFGTTDRRFPLPLRLPCHCEADARTEFPYDFGWVIESPLSVGAGRGSASVSVRVSHQVEWVSFPDFLGWMLYQEGVSVQSVVQVNPHVIDTALLYITFIRSASDCRLHSSSA